MGLKQGWVSLGAPALQTLFRRAGSLWMGDHHPLSVNAAELACGTGRDSATAPSPPTLRSKLYKHRSSLPRWAGLEAGPAAQTTPTRQGLGRDGGSGRGPGRGLQPATPTCEGLQQLLLRGLRVAAEQGVQRHHHPGRAEAALRAVALGDPLLRQSARSGRAR